MAKKKNRPKSSIGEIERKLLEAVAEIQPKINQLEKFLAGLSPEKRMEFTGAVEGGVKAIARLPEKERKMAVIAFAIRKLGTPLEDKNAADK